MALRTLGLLLLIISCFTLQALCLQIHLSIKDDTRPAFYIQNFGFEAGGVEELTLTKWKHTPKIVGPVGFLVTRTDTDASAFLEVRIFLCSDFLLAAIRYIPFISNLHDCFRAGVVSYFITAARNYLSRIILAFVAFFPKV
jgi:hypothetical protein